MVGFVEGPRAQLHTVLDLALQWFSERRADTWVDADQYSALFQHQALIDECGFRLVDDWDVMICREPRPTVRTERVTLQTADDRQDILTAAWIAEQVEHRDPVDHEHPAVRRRMQRYWSEYRERGSRFVLGVVDGRPVGTARLTDEPLPLVIGVATLAEARGRGVATAITRMLTNEAIAARGACGLYVERESQAARIYAGLGYRPLFRTRAWVHRFAPSGL